MGNSDELRDSLEASKYELQLQMRRTRERLRELCREVGVGVPDVAEDEEIYSGSRYNSTYYRPYHMASRLLINTLIRSQMAARGNKLRGTAAPAAGPVPASPAARRFLSSASAASSCSSVSSCRSIGASSCASSVGSTRGNRIVWRGRSRRT